jgi:hypothetical protein
MTSKIKTAVKNFVQTFIDPTYPARQAEAEYLRTVYRDNGNVIVRRDQFYRLVNVAGCLTGFEYVCLCGISYKLIDINLFTQSHVCPTCKNHFDLFKAVNASKDTKPSDWPGLFAQLPMRPAAVAKSSPPFMDTWVNNKSDAVEYETADLKFT